jgi:hypothetical protein
MRLNTDKCSFVQDFETKLIESITKVAENELEVNQSLLSSSRGKAAILIEGVIDRSGIYQEAEAHIKRLLEDHVGTIEDGIRAIRRDDVGEEAAAEEEARGSKTDDQYAEEAATRRQEREKLREELREKERAIAEERRKIEKARKREEEPKKTSDERSARQGENLNVNQTGNGTASEALIIVATDLVTEGVGNGWMIQEMSASLPQRPICHAKKSTGSSRKHLPCL